MSSPALRDGRDDNARFEIETGPGVDLTFELAERASDRRLERRCRRGDSAVVPVLTVRYEPPLSEASCDALRVEQDDAPAAWVGSVRIESARVEPSAIELTLAPLTEDLVPLETLRRHARVGLSADLAVSFVVDVATAMSGSAHGALHPRRVVVLADGAIELVGTRARGSSRVLAPALSRAEREAWTAPEVRWGDAPDTKSDVFALGLLLFYLLTDDLDPETLVRRARAAEHETTIPHDLARVIMRAVDPDPATRFVDALAFGQAVTAALVRSKDRAVIVEALRYIIDAGRGGLAAMLGAVVEPERLETRSIEVSVVPVAGFERAADPDRIPIAPPFALDGPRVITEKSNAPSIEPRPVSDRALPLPVQEPKPLMRSASEPRPAFDDYAKSPEPPNGPPPWPVDEVYEEPIRWTPTHLLEAPAATPRPMRRFALAGAVAGLALAMGVGWTFAPTDAGIAAREMQKAATRAEPPLDAPTAPTTEEVPIVEPAVESVAEETVVTPEPSKPLDLMSIMSRPLGATVSIDGRVVGRTPLVVKRELQPREYRVEVRLGGHRTWYRTVQPDEQGTISLVAELEEDEVPSL